MNSNLEPITDEIVRHLKKLHSRVSEAIKQSMKAFEDLDADFAENALTTFEDIENMHHTIEDMAFGAITTYQPLDKDLRRLVSFIHTSNNLKNVGRYTQKILEIVVMSQDLDHFKELESLPYLSELASAALAISIRAVLEEDLSEIDQLEKLEAQSDKEAAEMFKEIVDYLSRYRDISNIAMLYIIVGRYFERAADQAISIAESAVYLVTGERKKLGNAYEGIDDFSDLMIDI
ncbi:hypothetical protein EU527_16555 [Candidatus Thorarchaeota archaeon]|nr:MAG: hypothetical protein EU527_16555 [Candidatus Thorarchaeota archaeon]